eukprot:833242-Rhodomonas_salina.1
MDPGKAPRAPSRCRPADTMSDIRHQISVIRHPSSVIRHPSSGLASALHTSHPARTPAHPSTPCAESGSGLHMQHKHTAADRISPIAYSSLRVRDVPK